MKRIGPIARRLAAHAAMKKIVRETLLNDPRQIKVIARDLDASPSSVSEWKSGRHWVPTGPLLVRFAKSYPDAWRRLQEVCDGNG